MAKKKSILWVLFLSICILLQIRPITVSAEKPDIIIENVSISDSSISKGETFTASFDLHNNSAGHLRNIYIQVESSDFSVLHKGAAFKVADQLDHNTSVSVTLAFKCHATLSNRIPLKITYDDYTGENPVIEEQLLVTFDDSATNPGTPKFMITSGDIQTLGIGKTGKVKIKVQNNSDYAVKKVLITPELSSDVLSYLNINQIYMKPTNSQISAGGEQSFEYELTVNGTATPGIYPITYKVVGEGENKEACTASLSGYIKVTANDGASDIQVVDVKTTPEIPARDKVLTFQVEIEKESGVTYKNLNVWLEGLATETFIYQEKKLKKSPKKNGDDTLTASFDYKIASNAAEGTYPYEVHISYTDKMGNSIHNKESYQLYLKPEGVKKGALEINNLILPDQVQGEETFSVGFSLYNSGENNLENIEVAFNGTAEVMSKGSSNVRIDQLAPGKSKKAQFKLVAVKQEQTRGVPISFQITYDEKAGDEVETKTIIQSMGVMVKGDKEGTTAPKIIVDQLDMPDTILLGEEFELSFALTNTSTEKSIKNMKMTINSIDSVTQTSNIVIVGQSDSVYFAKLDSEEQVTSKVKMMIPATYKGSVCDVKFDFSYEDTEGTIYTDQETIHIPVAEQTQLTASNVRVGNVRDDGYTLEVDFYNTGKALLKNLMVDLEGDYEAINSNYYVGDLPSGRMDIYSVSINGEIPEQLTGNVLFTYEDNGGNKQELTVPFDIHYEKPVEEVMAVAEETNERTFYITPFFIVVIVIAVVVIFIIRKRRKAV
jgi:hypothetical protein